MDSNSLNGQVAVVTGASRGIGREVARALAMAGAKVAVTARNADLLEETASIISKGGGESCVFVMDVTDSESVVQTFDAITSQYGAIDLLVNNAGVGAIGESPWDADVDKWWNVQEVNVKGVFMCSKAVLPDMIKRGQGRIINMGSLAGVNATPDASAYSVSKAALMRLTDSTAAATKDVGVAIFVISPGLVLTDMTKDVPIFGMVQNPRKLE
jgi:3-oxoacyl-[acyl-carrier protein] reductase